MFYHLMHKFGILCLLLWKAFIFEQIVSVYSCSHIVCSLMKVTAYQADLMIHPYIVKSLLYFTCIQSIHSSTYAHATEWYVGSPTDSVCLAVSCVLVFLVFNMWERVCWWSRCLPRSLQGETRRLPLLFWWLHFPVIIFSKPLLDPNCGRKITLL